MAKIKLTLTIEESLVVHAKTKARQRRQSLSEMIEGFLISSRPEVESPSHQPMTEALLLRGVAKSALSKKSDKQIRAMMYRDKYDI